MELPCFAATFGFQSWMDGMDSNKLQQAAVMSVVLNSTHSVVGTNLQIETGCNNQHSNSQCGLVWLKLSAWIWVPTNQLWNGSEWLLLNRFWNVLWSLLSK